MEGGTWNEMLRERLQVGRWGVEGEKELGNVDQDNEGGKKGHEVKVMILRHSVVAHLCAWREGGEQDQAGDGRLHRHPLQE